ncbi:hypothetical protein FA10DRAFT_258601 [Acaromyces ingoldii]|uniref:Conserved oligomeric Golgi complex subunit 8 n=1 Tax=Acaromyces ingoldii TaxID=215250 RepID=A0A316YNP8_9BASI|nr:hypothetical protein FA10DRAFT_258601 [Acaromyces ingoldii]PWN91170.1 hypothetical protein FA10DRAFT_258601 [Acaromyces ingoldii]
MAAATTASINGSGGHDGDALLSLLMRGAGANEGLLDLGGSSSSSSSSYLHSLTSKSLADLRVQPAALTTTITSLDGQLSTLCARHVDSFVQVRQASSSLPRGLDALDAKLDSLLDSAIPRLAQASQRFPSAAQPHLEAKRRAQALLKQHRSSLADVLELPALLATCVRANHPVEALQLGIHIAKLSRPADSFATAASSSHSIPFPGEAARGHAVLVALRREAWQHLVVLRDDLLKGLDARGLRLPVARRYVSLLRIFSEVDHEAAGGPSRGDAIQAKQQRGGVPPKLALSDSTICLSLLRSRYAALVSRLENATSSHEEASDAASRCSARISVWREAVNDAIGMALALFVDRPAQPASSSNTTSAVDANADTSDGAAEEADSQLSPTMLISAFASKALHLLGASLDADVPGITSSAFERHPASYSKAATDVLSTFASLHTQLSYASVSLARLGLDFSGSLSSSSSSSSSTAGTCGAFEREVLRVWTRGLRRATDVFSQRWASSADVASLLASASAATVSKMLRFDTNGSRTTTTDAATAPSRDLLDVPALATLLNHLLEAYNALQTFCPAAIGQEVGEVLDETLDQTVELALGLASRLDMAEAIVDGGPSTDSIAALLPALDVQLGQLGQGAGEGEREDVASTSRDPQRLKEAQRMLAATVLSLLERDVVGFVRPHVVRLVSGGADGDVGVKEERAGLKEKRRAVVAWAAQARETWETGEEKRRDALLKRLEARRAESERERRKREEEESARRAKEEEETRAREEKEEKLRKEEEERARRAKEEEARLERERLEKERVEKERLERERLEKERLEKERLEKERLEKERLEKERLEKERLEKERLEKERLEKGRVEKERLEKERLEKVEREQEEMRKKEQEERQKREEEERLKREEEERLKREEDERLRREEEDKLRRQREEEEKLKKEEEERRVREEKELAAKKRQEEEERRAKEEEQEKKRVAEEEAAKEEAQRKKKEEEEAKRQAEAEKEAKAKAKEELAKTEQEKDAAAGSEIWVDVIGGEASQGSRGAGEGGSISCCCRNHTCAGRYRCKGSSSE